MVRSRGAKGARSPSFQREGAHETAEFHGGALVLAPALPVEPAQGGARDADPLGPLEQRLESQSTAALGTCKCAISSVRRSMWNARARNRGPVRELMAHLDPQRRHEAHDRPSGSGDSEGLDRTPGAIVSRITPTT